MTPIDPKFIRLFRFLWLLITVVFSYSSLGFFYMAQLETSNLEAQTGQVKSIGVRSVNEKGHRNNTFPLFILLNNSENEFRLSENFTNQFERLQSDIKPGDEITIYHRNLFQTILGLGKPNDVFQINSGSKVILSINTIKSNYFLMSVFAALLSTLSWLAYYYYRKNKANNKFAI